MASHRAAARTATFASECTSREGSTWTCSPTAPLWCRVTWWRIVSARIASCRLVSRPLRWPRTNDWHRGQRPARWRAKPPQTQGFRGGAEGLWTPDPLDANKVRSGPAVTERVLRSGWPRRRAGAIGSCRPNAP